MLPLHYVLPPTAAFVYRALKSKSLTNAGIVAALLTAGIHAFSPSSPPFFALFVFYALGTAATRYKAEVKARLTVDDDTTPPPAPAKGKSAILKPKKKARGATQVFCNSGAASLFLGLTLFTNDTTFRRALVLGAMCSYAAAAADTLSSELGILSKSKPRLIYAPWRECLPGENGGVTLVGLAAGAVGAGVIALMASESQHIVFGLGFFGTVLDSLFGALCQGSVVRGGKVVENELGGDVRGGGERRGGVLGLGWNNNMVNAATVATVGVLGVRAGLNGW